MNDRLIAIAFNTMSTRNAGFATIDLNALSDATINTYSVMMFIGSGPGSTAGGIRTTTLFVIVITIVQFIRGKKAATAFKRELPVETVKKSFILALTAMALVIASSILIQVIETGNAGQTIYYYTEQIGIGNDWNSVTVSIQYQDALFVAFSAFGTTGLSTVDISQLQIGSKVILIILMFVGQLGILNALKIFSGREKVSKRSKQAKMIVEDIAIG
jgi:Trk-type K+ transport system membrane component